MVHGAGEIAVREGDSAKRAVAQRFPRRRLAVQTEKESGLGIVAETVEYDPRDVALRFEARSLKHFGELLANLALVLGEWSVEKFHASRTVIGLAGLLSDGTRSGLQWPHLTARGAPRRVLRGVGA